MTKPLTIKSIKWAMRELGHTPPYLHQLLRREVLAWQEKHLSPEQVVDLRSVAREHQDPTPNMDGMSDDAKRWLQRQDTVGHSHFARNECRNRGFVDSGDHLTPLGKKALDILTSPQTAAS